MHRLGMPREEIAFTARLKIHSHSQIFRYGWSIFCLQHWPNFSDIFDLCLHWVSVVRVWMDQIIEKRKNTPSGYSRKEIWPKNWNDVYERALPPLLTQWFIAKYHDVSWVQSCIKIRDSLREKHKTIFFYLLFILAAFSDSSTYTVY